MSYDAASDPSAKLIEAQVVIINHDWYVQFVIDDISHCKAVTDEDAWDYDIERGMIVILEWKSDHTFRIVRRKRGNKKFVQIGKHDDTE